MIRKMGLVLASSFASLVVLAAHASGQGAVSEEHKVLHMDAGTWTAKGKMWMPGAADSTEFEGKEVNSMIGDFWCTSRFEGNFFGTEFVGTGTFGYDESSKKYHGVWMDSMNPNMTKMHGTYDQAKKTMTFQTEGKDMTGRAVKGKNVVHYKDEDTRVMTMYEMDGDEMRKTMEIVYSRAK